MKTQEETLHAINAELKAAKVGITIRQRGDRLSLRGTLPPKPGSDKTKPYQQDIALNIYANPSGFRRAKSEALRVGGLLACKEFTWDEWLDPLPDTEAPSLPSKKIADFLQEFEEDYFTRKARTAKTETTFRDYQKTWELFKDVNTPLTTDTILEAVRSTPPDSHKRKRTCMAMKALAKFAGIEINLKPYQGKYSPYAAIQERNLPSDEFIEEWRDRIPNPAWRWAYGIIATYGIRSHELFYLDTSLLAEPPGILIVLPGAKNDNLHKVWPCLPIWWEKWKLWEVNLPQCSGPDNSALGHRVSRAFNRYNIPFPPYNLRHAWAIRTAVAGLDPAIAARMMDHSLDVHTNLYHRWIGDKHFQQAWENMRFSTNL